jgi:nitroreductase
VLDVAAADKLLTTTRSVRRRLDLERPVPAHLIEECITVALQAPTGSNQQGWAFVVVTDPAKRKALAELYRRGGQAMAEMGYAPPEHDDPEQRRVTERVNESARYLTPRLEDVPVHVIPCVKGRVEGLPSVLAQASTYGSILPAAWSFMLAARARGLGSAWTTIHLAFEQEASELLGIPPEWTQAALLPVAYYTGDDFRPAKRLPAASLTHWDAWGEPLTSAPLA